MGHKGAISLKIKKISLYAQKQKKPKKENEEMCRERWLLVTHFKIIISDPVQYPLPALVPWIPHKNLFLLNLIGLNHKESLDKIVVFNLLRTFRYVISFGHTLPYRNNKNSYFYSCFTAKEVKALTL